MPLAAELVDFAAMAYLVFQLPGLLVPVPGAGLLVVGVEQLPIGQADGLVEVGAVEQVLFCPGLSLFKQGAVRGRCFRLAQVGGHFLAGPQGGEIKALEPGIGAVQLHIQGVVLPPLQHAVLVPVPAVGVGGAPGVFEGQLDLRPQGAEPIVVPAQLPSR